MNAAQTAASHWFFPMELPSGRKTFWSFLQEEDHSCVHTTPFFPSPLHHRHQHSHQHHQHRHEQRGHHRHLRSPLRPHDSSSAAAASSEPARFSSPRAAATAPSSPAACPSPWTLSPLSPHHHHPRSHRLHPHPHPHPHHSPMAAAAAQPPALLYHCLASLHRLDGSVLSLAACRGLLFTASDSGRVRVWSSPSFSDRGHLRVSPRGSPVPALLAHGSSLFTAHSDHRVRLWSLSSPTSSSSFSSSVRAKKTATLPARSPAAFLAFFARRHRGNHGHQQPHKDAVSCLALYHAEGLLYTGSLDRTVKAWRLADGACADSFPAHDAPLSALLVDQADGCLFTAAADAAVKVWRRVLGGDGAHALVSVLRFHQSPVNALALALAAGARSSTLLYSGTSDGYVNVWEKAAGSGRFDHAGLLQGHRFAVLCLAAVDRVVISGSEDTTIRVWRRDERPGGLHACLAVIEGHRGPVRCMAATVEVEAEADYGVGLLLYTASLDRTVKVWRIKVIGKEEEEEEEIAEEDDDNDEDQDEDDDDNDEEDDGGGGGGGGEKEVEFDTSPVLSPLWVEKRLQRSRLA